MNEHLEPGCYIDGHWGQYGADRLVQLAVELGWTPSDDEERILVNVANERIANMGPRLGEFDQQPWIEHKGYDAFDPDPPDYESEILEAVIELSTRIEDDLNNDHMPAGLRCGWVDGEFFIETDGEDE